jgi:hypothetical protein
VTTQLVILLKQLLLKRHPVLVTPWVWWLVAQQSPLGKALLWRLVTPWGWRLVPL